MFRNKSADVHQFAMVPRAEIPRSAFRMEKTLKTTFDSGYLVPVYVAEVLPGDHFNVDMTAFCRMATPIFPFMDNLYLESFFFFVPNRLVWSNWKKFMGEQVAPGDSISYVVPYIVSPAGGYNIGTLGDMMGLPTVGQVTAGEDYRHSALPFRAYYTIFNEWFRDENLVTGTTVSLGDGPDATAQYAMWRRGKRHDYFTSCLPWPQKGNTAVSLPLGVSAPVVQAPSTSNVNIKTDDGTIRTWVANQATGNMRSGTAPAGVDRLVGIPLASDGTPSNMIADLSAATAATINQIRQSFQIQKLLERDARGGTRYTEIVRAHFGVVSPDARLQRPEYLGGGKSPIVVNPIAQTSSTDATTPQGNLAAMATGLARNHGFNQSFTEHGYVIGLVSVNADLTYQQGLRRHWSRSTRYDYYFPAFAMLGEQAVLQQEIYCTGVDAADATVFGYQERWAEYRYDPSEICGLFRSTAAGTLDAWHLSQRFTAAPTLNSTFIQDEPPIPRVVAVTSTNKQFLFDALIVNKAARPLPMYSVPGMIDHF